MVRWGEWVENYLVDGVDNGKNSHKDAISTTKLASYQSKVIGSGRQV